MVEQLPFKQCVAGPIPAWPSGKMCYYVYILRSLKDQRNYVGITQNVEIRLKQHNWGKVRSTKSRRPLKLIVLEKYSTKTEALKREKYLKSYKGWKDRQKYK